MHIVIEYIVTFIGTHFYHSYMYSKITCILTFQHYAML